VAVTVISRKTLGDLSNPKLLAAFFVPFLAVGGFLALATADNEIPEDVATLPLHAQELQLAGAFAPLSYIWGAGVPVLVLGAVLAAMTLATEAEHGTLRILLSKPIRRWEVVVGVFGAITLFSFLLAVACLLLVALLLFQFADASPGALGGIFGLMPGNLAYALFVSVVIAAVGTVLSVVTRNRVRTLLGGLVFPVFYFVFLPVRVIAGDFYRDYALYLVDINYHFGNAFVFLHERVGDGFTPEMQATLAVWTGVYDPRDAAFDPLLGGLPPSLEPVGHVPQVVSLGVLAALAVGAFAFAVHRFQRMDVA